MNERNLQYIPTMISGYLLQRLSEDLGDYIASMITRALSGDVPPWVFSRGQQITGVIPILATRNARRDVAWGYRVKV